ncbi:MAG: adenylate/guanylate cyclase domain-containing protein [Synechococcaceae cyanobacterium RL_1_2]|nr:adenylate/guanylate cyclase domain-containing protein [Synechococcaceae cyanobacterium RL_1_2]
MANFSLKPITNLNSKLSHKIIFWIFLAIIVIETIILIPSTQRRERELLTDVQGDFQDKVIWLLLTSPDTTPPQEVLQQIENIVKYQMTSGPQIDSGSIYLAHPQEGTINPTNPTAPIITFGDYHQMNDADLKLLEFKPTLSIDKHQDHYHLTWAKSIIEQDYWFEINLDKNYIRKDLLNFKIRIFFLVILISMFVTMVAIVVLNILIIGPVLALRDDLTQAGKALTSLDVNDRADLDFYANSARRNDELGDVMTTFVEMYHLIRTEQEKSERLLLNVLPEAIAQRLKEGASCIADGLNNVSILFADIVGFTTISERTSPTDLLEMLNGLFSSFDLLCEHHGVEKIKTIGDAYMIASGLPEPRTDHVAAIADMALAMMVVVDKFNETQVSPLSLRIGINCGAVVAGVIGKKKFIYDLWGDAVNTAARMESHGVAGSIQVTEDVYLALKDQYRFQKRGLIDIKGKGEMMTYLLMGKK